MPFLGVLYYTWFVTVLALIFCPGSEGKRRDIENVLLVSIFALVFSGVWISLSHGYFGADSFVPAGGAQFVKTGGHLYYQLSSGVVEFPTLTLLTYYVSQIPSLGIFDAVTLLLIFEALIFSILIYLFFRNLTEDKCLAALGVIMVIGGSMTIADFLPQLHARITGLIFLVACLMLLSNNKQNIMNSTSRTLIFLVFLAAITITHAITGFVLICILIGIFMMHIRTNKIMLLVVLSIVSFGAYEIFISLGISHYMLSLIPSLINNIVHEHLFSFITGVTISSIIGGILPLWANMTTIFWLLVIACGGIIWVSKFINFKGLSFTEKTIQGGLVGVSLFLIISGLATQLIEALNRGLFYIPIFTDGILLLFLFNLKKKIQNIVLVVLVSLICILSLPTFLTQNDSVATSTLHSQEIASAEYLDSYYSKVQRLTVFTSEVYPAFFNYFSPEITKYVWFPGVIVPGSKDEVWTDFNNFETQFEFPKDYSTNILIYSPRIKDSLYSMLGEVSNITPKWVEFTDKLSQENMVYNNGFILYYHARN